jgi:hypothetical protein
MLLGLGACDGYATLDDPNGSSTSGSGIEPGDGGPGGGVGGTGGGTVSTGGGTTGAGGGTHGTGGGGAGAGGGSSGAGGGASSARLPLGWLYTVGNTIHVSDGNGGGPVWVGRGVNVDDVFLCGYNWGLWMTPAASQAALGGLISTLITDWKSTFFRISLSMNSSPASNPPAVTWTTNLAQYATPMTTVIKGIGASPGVYALVTLRTDGTMNCAGGDTAVCLPTAATDDVYRALVGSFKNDRHVLFGVANEPAGNDTSVDVKSLMAHAVSVIRAEEDRLGVPHHVVAVQGKNYTSTLGFYNAAPIAADNVVYEYHSYPPTSAGYTWSNLPVIIGEYGPDLLGYQATPATATLPNAAALFADLEAKHISSLAWEVSPYSDCVPDMVAVTQSGTLTPNAWGSQVKAYLQAHAP